MTNLDGRTALVNGGGTGSNQQLRSRLRREARAWGLKYGPFPS